MKNILILGLSLAAGLTLPIHAQEEDNLHSEIGVSALGAFTHTVNGNGTNQSVSDSGGILVDYRYQFTRRHGVEVDYGYTRSTQLFSMPLSAAGVQDNMHEVTASYVYRIPMGRLAPFASAGTGAVVFDPISTSGLLPAVAGTQTRATFVYGAGLEYALTRHLSFRAEYRGLVFKAPSFGIGGFGADAVTHLAEPAGGFVWRF